MYKYKNEHNRQQADDWLWDTIPNRNIRFDVTVKEFDFIKNVDEPYVYKKTSGGAIVFLILYVDDILLIGNNIPML